MVTDGLGWTRRGVVTTRVRLHCESCSELLRAARSCSELLPGGGGLGSKFARMCVSKSEGHRSIFGFKGVK